MTVHALLLKGLTHLDLRFILDTKNGTCTKHLEREREKERVREREREKERVRERERERERERMPDFRLSSSF